MFRLLAVFSLACLLRADERWLVVKSGPFQVLSAAGDKPAREQLNQLEQFRHALGNALGKNELTLLWPLRVVIAKAGTASDLRLGRDAYMATTEHSGLTPSQLAQLARLLLDQNSGRLPEDIESGLLDLFSTVQISGTHITLGAPPPQRSRAWARMQLLSVDPNYAGRSRVMMSNLEQGSDMDVAYKNAFQKTAAQIEKQVDAYVAAGAFGTVQVSGRAISPKDFRVQPADAVEAKLALADLALAGALPGAGGLYNAIHGPEGAEGLGLLALAARKKNEAKMLFDSALESGTKNARAWFEAALLDPDPAGSRKKLDKAAELNPRWAEPPYRLALLDKDPARKAADLKKAATLDPRKVEYWQALAKTETEASHFTEAQKAWGGAERAAVNAAEREKIRQVRLGLQAERADYEASERRRKAEEEARDLERVKNESLAAIHQSEAGANKRLNPDGGPPPKAVEWWSGPEAGGKVEGMLLRFDCVGRQARLVVKTADGKTVQIAVRDPSRIVLPGGGETSLACGAQATPRKVLVLYTPKADKRFGTAGEAVSVEFR